MNIKFENRRRFHRINFDGQVNLDFMGDQHNHCQIKNLSLTGMFVTGNFPPPQTKSCLINISHNRKSEKIHLRASGKVVRSTVDGIGVNFTSMTLDNYMLLHATLIDEAEFPLVLLSEFPEICPFEITSN